MKSLKEIISSGQRAWFYIEKKENRVAFAKEAKVCGCTWVNDDEIVPEKDDIGSRMGISGKKLGYVSAMCWCFKGQGKPKKYRYPSLEIISEDNDVIKMVGMKIC